MASGAIGRWFESTQAYQNTRRVPGLASCEAFLLVPVGTRPKNSQRLRSRDLRTFWRKGE